MARIAGIQTTKDQKGNLAKVTIDLKKHGAAARPLLEQLGVIEKSQFDKDCEQGGTLEELRQKMYAKIKEKQWSTYTFASG